MDDNKKRADSISVEHSFTSGPCSACGRSTTPSTLITAVHAPGRVDATTQTEMPWLQRDSPVQTTFNFPDASDAHWQTHDYTFPIDQPSVATLVAPEIEADLDVSDEGYAESTSTSYVTSIASDIKNGVLENGRVYPSYGKHGYGLPTDEEEMDRLDLQHSKYWLVIGNKHFLAPIGPNPQRILDLGTGTGIWALDVADIFPSAQVLGVDIAPIQPKWVAPNCQFEIDDIEEQWTYREATFDFIHGRDFLYCVRDYPKLLRQCYRALKPGGWVELACIHPIVKCDDGSMPQDSAFRVVCDKFYEASLQWGTPSDAPVRYAQQLHDAGFTDISENIFKVPSAPWPRNPKLKQIGALEMTNVVEGAQGFGLRVFEQIFGWSKEKTELVMIDFRRDVKNRAFHQYCQYFVVYGRKPL